MNIGKQMLGRRHVLPSVVNSLAELQIEGTFPTGTYLVTVHYPVSTDDGNLEKALYGSFLPVPSKDLFPMPDASEFAREKQPGAVIPVKNSRIILNKDRKRIKLKVVSKGDRPIQVCKDLKQSFYPVGTNRYLGGIALSFHRNKPAT
jgi:urease